MFYGNNAFYSILYHKQNVFDNQFRMEIRAKIMRMHSLFCEWLKRFKMKRRSDGNYKQVSIGDLFKKQLLGNTNNDTGKILFIKLKHCSYCYYIFINFINSHRRIVQKCHQRESIIGKYRRKEFFNVSINNTTRYW